MSSVNKRTVLLVIWLAILGGLFALITHISSLPGSPAAGQTTPAPKISIRGLERQWPQITAHAAAPPRGAAGAAYTLAEFGDFQCPQCGKMRTVIEGMIARSNGQANMIFCQRPFPQDHPYAEASAAASLAAAAQGKFWPMYDALYEHQDDLEPGFYDDYAKEAGLNVPQFHTAMAGNQSKAAEAADARFADSLNIQITPTLLVHDNKTGQIKVYIGSDSTAPGAVVGYKGIVQLAAAPPWAAVAAASAH